MAAIGAAELVAAAAGAGAAAGAEAAAAAAAPQEFTLCLPRNVIEMLRRAAVERQESPDQIVAKALQHVLDPVRLEALQQLKHQVLRQRSQSESQVRANLDTRLASKEQQRLSQLLDRNRTDGLTMDEEAEMDRLFERIEAVATEKAAAIWLLSGKSTDADDLP